MSERDSFFDEQREQSAVKAAIVSKYFEVWAKIMLNSQASNIAYIDLFSGPGLYKDGSKSTPILILEKAINDPALCKRLITVFNDKDDDNVRSLREALKEIDGIQRLNNQPEIHKEEVGSEIVKQFETTNFIPTFFFIDPFGYKGLSLKLVNSVIKDWGCDCIFFFCYNRINPGLDNEIVEEPIDALFGEERAESLRTTLFDSLTPQEREFAIVEEICKALKSDGGKYTLPFRFKDSKGTRTSHHLIFVSKHFKGYEIMKEIMAKESSSQEEGVPSFEYSPADFLPKQGLLFNMSRPLGDLEKILREQFKGRTLKMKEIYQQHSVDTPYVKKNYKEVLQKLDEQCIIKTSPHRKNSFGDDVTVTFP